MNTQKALQALLKIAQNQQKMIERLAQLTNQPLPPQKLEPAPKLDFNPEQVVLDHLSPALRATLRSAMPIVAHGQELTLFFAPGHATQANLDHITQVVQKLVSSNKLPFAYSVRASA